MAQDQKTISQPQSGMVRDLHPGQLDDRQYTFALNATIETDDGNMGMRSSEPANLKCLDLEGWKVVGYKNDLISGYLYLFLSNETDGTSKISYFHPTWEVTGLTDEQILAAAAGTEEICAGLQTLIEDSEDDPCLNFSVYHPIKTIEIKNEKCGRCIYWTDGLNPPRYVIIEKALEGDIDGDIWYHYHGFKICGEKKEDGSILTREEFLQKNGCVLACEKLRVFPLMEQPCIEPESIAYGGSLRAGVYQFSVALCDEFGNELTNYGPLTNPVHIFDEHDITMRDGIWGARTNLGIRLTVTNIDRQSEYFKIVVVQNTVGYNGESQPVVDYFIEGIHPVTEKTIYYYTDLNNKRTTFEHISYKRPVYNTSEGIATVDNRLLQYKLTAEKEWNLQPIVSLMGHFLKWHSSVSTGDLYKDGNACSLYVGYMRDEVYPFGISFRTKSGYTTPIFTFIPHPSEYARIDASTEENLATPIESIESNVPNCYDMPRQYVWQYRNTCSGGTSAEDASILNGGESTAEEEECKNPTIIKQTFVESRLITERPFTDVELSVFDTYITDIPRYLSDNILNIACSNTENDAMNQICEFISAYNSAQGNHEEQFPMDGVDYPVTPSECSDTVRQESILEVPYDSIENPRIETEYLPFEEMTRLNEGEIVGIYGERTDKASYMFDTDAQDEFQAYIDDTFFPCPGNDHVKDEFYSCEQREALTPSVYIAMLSSELAMFEEYENSCGDSVINACDNLYSVNGIFNQYQSKPRLVCSYIRPDDFWNQRETIPHSYDEYAPRTFPGVLDKMDEKIPNVTWMFYEKFDTGCSSGGWVNEFKARNKYQSKDWETYKSQYDNAYGLSHMTFSGWKEYQFYPKLAKNCLWFRVLRPEAWDNPDYEGRKVIYFEAFGRSGVTNIDLASSEYIRISFWKDSQGTPLNIDLFGMGEDAEYKSANSYVVNVASHYFVEITEDQFKSFGVSDFYITVDSPFVAGFFYHASKWHNSSDGRYAMVGGFVNAGKSAYPYVIAMREKEVSGFTMRADKLYLKANVTFVSSCMSCGDKPINCAPREYRYGDFGYYESSHLYPANYELWDSSRARMDLSRTYEDERKQKAIDEIKEKMQEWYGAPKVDERGLSYYEGTEYGGTTTSTLFCQQPIRHYRFPDNFHTHFMNTDLRSTSESSEIYPVGVMINESVIDVFLDFAVDSGYITKEQRDNITAYELYRGDRRLNKSVVGCGLAFDMMKYADNDGTVNLYPNYPYNDLSDDQYHYIDGQRVENVHHPFSRDGNIWYSLISPDFYFNKPQTADEVTIDGYMRGMSSGCFVNVENHPKWTMLSEEGYRMARRLASTESLAQLMGEVCELFAMNVVQGASGGLLGAVIGSGVGVAGFVLGASAKLMQRAAYYGKYLSDWINTFINNGPRINYAYYYSSIGQYTSMFALNDYATYLSDSVRGLAVCKMINPGIIPMNDASMETMYYINNVFRERSMYLCLGNKSFITHYPTNVRSYDSSRVDDMIIDAPDNIAGSAYEKTKQLSYVASPYMRLKIYKPNQYGDIEDISWISIGGNCSMDGYYKFYFGGDTFISKFAMKRKLPLFYNNCYNMGDMIPFPYDDYRNIAFPRYFVNFETGMTEDAYTDTESFRQASSDALGSDYFYPYRISYYNLNGSGTTGRNGRYLTGRFYLWFYGIPEFYVESDINCNFRLRGVLPHEQFYPDTTDFVWWTQEKNVSIEQDNDFKISPIYHARMTIPQNVLPATYEKKFYDCAYQRPNGVIWSRQDVSENSQTDPWLVYRPMDYYEFPSRNGDLVHIKRIESNQLLVRFTDQVALHNAIDVIKERTAGQVGVSSEMGTGGLFASRPLEYNTTDLGYSGTQSTEIISSEFGHFWVDAKRGSVFMTDPNGRNLQELSTGVRAWLKKHLPFKILKYGITKRGTSDEITYDDVDNKFIGLGLSLGWDNRYKRILITKLDYIPVQQPAYYTFEDGRFYFNNSEVSLHDTAYFENVSFTIGYNLLSKEWLSYYSFIPEYYVDQQDGFLSALNVDSHTIWSHLMENKAFCTFYGTTYPFILEVPVKEKYVGSILSSVEYELDARKYSDDVTYTTDPKIGLDSVVIYNDSNNSGELRLVPAEKNNMQQRISYPKVGDGYTEILDTEVYGRHKINDFFNRTADYRSEEPFWTKDKNEIMQEVNPAALSYQTRWKDRLRGSWFLMRVKKLISDRRIIFRWIIDEFKIKNR